MEPEGWRTIIIGSRNRFGQPLPSKKFWNRYARVRVAVEGAKATCPHEEVDTVRLSAFDAPLRIAGDGGYAGKRG